MIVRLYFLKQGVSKLLKIDRNMGVRRGDEGQL